MPENWDEIVLLLYKTFGAGPAGRQAAGRLLELVYGRGLFQPAGLTDRSILLILLLSRDGSSLHMAAHQELLDRNLYRPEGQERAAGALSQAEFRDDRRLLSIVWSGDPHARSILFRFAESVYAARMRTFLARLLLTDIPPNTASVFGLVVRSWGTYAQGLPGDLDYPSQLYADALLSLQAAPGGPGISPTAWPDPPAILSCLGGVLTWQRKK